MEAIIYTSNTGTTKEYAEMLGKETEASVYTVHEAKYKVQKGADIIYLGWLVASKVKGYSKIKNKYNVLAVCGVGMGRTGSQLAEVKKANRIDNSKLFVLQGGFDINKLHGIYGFMMKGMSKMVSKMLTKKENKTAEEIDTLDLMKNGGSRVSPENLKGVIEWINDNNF